MCYNQARKKKHKLKLLGPDIFRWWGFFHMKGWGPKSLVCPSKPRETELLGATSRFFAGMSRGCPICLSFLQNLCRKGSTSGTPKNSKFSPPLFFFGDLTPPLSRSPISKLASPDISDMLEKMGRCISRFKKNVVGSVKMLGIRSSQESSHWSEHAMREAKSPATWTCLRSAPVFTGHCCVFYRPLARCVLIPQFVTLFICGLRWPDLHESIRRFSQIVWLSRIVSGFPN